MPDLVRDVAHDDWFEQVKGTAVEPTATAEHKEGVQGVAEVRGQGDAEVRGQDVAEVRGQAENGAAGKSEKHRPRAKEFKEKRGKRNQERRKPPFSIPVGILVDKKQGLSRSGTFAVS